MKRFKRILAVFSDEFEPRKGIECLALLAEHAEAEGVDVLEVTGPRLAEYPAGAGAGCEGVSDELRECAETYLGRRCLSLGLAEGGGLRDSLARLAEGIYDLVVVPVGDTVGRSLAERLARKSPVGVLVLPPASVMPAERVIAAIDFSDLSPSVLDWASAFSTLHGDGARKVAAHVLDLTIRTRATMIFDVGELKEEMRTGAARQLDEFVAERGEEGAEWEKLIVEGQLAGVELGSLVRREGELLVIGGRGRNALSVALLGSHVAEVVRRAERPVLVVKRKNESLGFLRELIGWKG